MSSLVENSQVLVDGRPAIVKRSVSDQNRLNFFSPATPRPQVVASRPVVGQWKDKWITPKYGQNVVPNPDPASHIDFEAWANAFSEVYDAS